MAKTRRKSTECLNCGTELAPEDNYCRNCGQENHDKRVTVGLLIKDLFREHWALDNKAFRSLVPLLTKPGFLTKEFMKGRRVSYNRPLRLYLFMSFMFFVITASVRYVKGGDVEPSIVQIDTARTGLQYGDQPELRDSLKEVDATTKYFMEKEERFNSPEGQKQMSEELDRNLPVAFFLLIPLLAFWMYVFFWRKKSFYVDAFVFALHVQTFLFVIQILRIPLNSFVTVDILALITIAIVLIYSFIAAKKVYEFSWLGTVLRMLAVTVSYLITAALLLILYVVVVFFIAV